MTTIADGAPASIRPTIGPWPLAFFAAASLTLLLYLARDRLGWANLWPEAHIVPFAAWLTDLMAWLKAIPAHRVIRLNIKLKTLRDLKYRTPCFITIRS